MLENFKNIIKNNPRYKNFVLLDKEEKFDELFKNYDFDVVQVHDANIYEAGNEKYIVGFCGVFQWLDGRIKSLDGDIYSEDTLIIGYKEFEDNEGNKCVDILVTEW